MSHQFFITLAQASSPTAGQAQGGGLSFLVPLICIIVIFYFIGIRPQSQRQKQQDAMIKAVKTGDKVITASGIHGMVSNIKDTTVILKIADNVKIEMEKSSIGSVVKRDDAPTA